MKTLATISLKDVQAVYSGPEGELWELIMGEQIHIGGFKSSMDLAERAGIGTGQRGVDLCSALGAGIRFLLRFRNVAHMTGVDATPKMIALARERCAAEGLVDNVTFVEADVCATGLPSGAFDFVWGEDAWCYVVDKPKLIHEAARLVKPGGKIAFTDWMEGTEPMTDAEANRFLAFMKFPNILTLDEYCALLRSQGCNVIEAGDTGRFPQYVPLYIEMVENQLTFDALKIIGFDTKQAEWLLGEMRFMQTLAEAGKIVQGLVVAEKTV